MIFLGFVIKFTCRPEATQNFELIIFRVNVSTKSVSVAAKFKLGTMAKVFKIAGNSLSKPIGMRAKSVVGADE